MRGEEDPDSEEDISLAKIDRSDSDESLEERFKPDSIDNMATPEEVRIQIADAMAQMSVKFEEKLLEQSDQILAQQREIYQFKQESVNNRQEPPHQQQQQVPAPYQHSRSEAKIWQLIQRGQQSALDLYKLIKLNCSHSNRQYKLKIVDQFLLLAGSKSPGNKLTLAKWTKVFTEIEQLKIPTSELCGLVLQNSFIAPAGVDKKTFDFSVDGKLEAQESPHFADVTTVIQFACGKGKAKSSQSMNDSYAPMDLDAIQAVGQGKYIHPNNRNSPAQQQRPLSNQRRPNLLLEKASFYKGQPNPSEALKAKYGAQCLVCDSDQHWYNNCDKYWGYVRSGVFEPPPKDFASPQLTYRPPPRPAQHQGRLRQIDVPEASEGKFLLDSGASTHVSGNLKHFVTRQILPQPKTIALAVADCTVDVRFKHYKH
ncbi:hypothetical protein PSTT_14638 [Puccinia striiformis]|uniref:Uncharacterized protein n=1 Tax=Puccinia striiformis TaxID=27350 RepID=A0A2S4ULD3_9BASI|nr:hypothetical protein PSTT_14638 [Puccinia striiformis]